MSQSIPTEELILEAARKVFARKGLEGARMQEIAEEAGINKALLHYYYRNKEKLFDLVFQEVFSKLVGSIAYTLNEDIPLVSKLEIFIDRYMELLKNNPFFPGFIITEIHRDPERIVKIFHEKETPIYRFMELMHIEMEQGHIRKVDPRHLLVHIISLCVFPFVARPILQGMLFDGEPAAYELFINERAEVVKALIRQYITQ